MIRGAYPVDYNRLPLLMVWRLPMVHRHLPHLVTYHSINVCRYSRHPNRECPQQGQHHSPYADEYPSDPDAQVEWHENKLKKLYKQSVGIDDDVLAFRKQLIPDAFTVPSLPLAAGIGSWLHTLVTKVHAAAQGFDSAREWIAKVKRDPDFDKYESAKKF